MRILITGVTSFLGIYTAEALLARGHRVIGAVRPGSRNEGRLRERSGLRGLRIAHFDFDALPAASEAAYRAQLPADMPVFDAWIHFSWDGIGSAGRADPAVQQRNIENAEKAYVMAKLLGCRKFLFAGSQAEYGRGNQAHPAPVSEYGKAKLRFGRWAREQSIYQELMENEAMAFLHLRIFSVYGVGDHPGSLVNALVQAVLAQQPLSLGPCTQDWNYLAAADLARALVLLTESPAAGTAVYDIAGQDTKPLRDYVEEIAEIAAEWSETHGAAARTAGASSPVAAANAETAAQKRLQAAELLRFGTRGNNSEGAADLRSDTRLLKSFGFQEKVSLAEGIQEICMKLCTQ